MFRKQLSEDLEDLEDEDLDANSQRWKSSKSRKPFSTFKPTRLKIIFANNSPDLSSLCIRLRIDTRMLKYILS